MTIPQPNDLDQMVLGQDYYVLVVAYNVASSEGVGDTFRAIKDVQKVDRVPPQPVSVMANGSVDKDGTITGGSVVLTFDKAVYWAADGAGDNTVTKDLYAVVGSNADPNDTNGTVGILYTQTGSVPFNESKASGKGSSFTLPFYKMNVNNSFVLFSNGRIANKSGYSWEMTITVKFEAQSTGGNNASGIVISGKPVAIVSWIDPQGVQHEIRG